MMPINFWRLLLAITVGMAVFVAWIEKSMPIGFAIVMTGVLWYAVTEVEVYARPKIHQVIRDAVREVMTTTAAPHLREMADSILNERADVFAAAIREDAAPPNLWVDDVEVEEGIAMTVVSDSPTTFPSLLGVTIDALPPELRVGMTVRQGERSWTVAAIQTTSALRSLSNGVSATLFLIGDNPTPRAGSVLFLDTTRIAVETPEVGEETPTTSVYEHLLADEDGAKS